MTFRILSFFLIAFLFSVGAEGKDVWCSPSQNDKFTLEWLEPNMPDLDERTLIVKHVSSGEVLAKVKGGVSNYFEHRDFYAMEDWNFDGCSDIYWESGMNPKGDKTYEVFLYSKTKKSFVYSEELSTLTELGISDSVNKCLSSNVAIVGQYGGVSDTYCWKDSELVLTKSSELSLDVEHNCSRLIKYELIHGDLEMVKNSCDSF